MNAVNVRGPVQRITGPHDLGAEILTSIIVLAGLCRIRKALSAVWCKFLMGEFAAAAEDVGIRFLIGRGLKWVVELEGFGALVFERVSSRDASHTPGGFFLSQHFNFVFSNGVSLLPSVNVSPA
jgi:hypothetical protein